MADKAISELIAANQVTSTDLFVLEQSGTAKKLTGQTLENWLLSMVDGHGGIQSITKVSTSGLVDTYRITMADNAPFDFTVTNGKSIKSIAKTKTSGLVDTYTISYNDSTSSTFTVTNGAKGDKGDNQYVWIKYASQMPTSSSHSFGDVPDNWIGIYSGGSSTAPTDWQQYNWFEIKGEKGNTGAAATVSSNEVEYQVSDSGTTAPSGTWSTIIPIVAQGRYLWTRITTRFNSGSPAVSYSVTRMGLDGSGSVASVANVSPDEAGNVPLVAENIGALPLRKSTPRNLLDNSNFRNPVNQRGATTLSGAGGFIDRWFGSNNRALLDLTSNGISFCNNGSTTGSAYFDQYLPEDRISLGKVYTIATCIDGAIDYMSGTLSTQSSTIKTNGAVSFRLFYSSSKNLWLARYTTDSTTSKTIEWAAIYEGEYTLDTLPEYQPKDHELELAECQRYFYKFSYPNTSYVRLFGYSATDTDARFVVDFPQEMRTKPTFSYTPGTYFRIVSNAKFFNITECTMTFTNKSYGILVCSASGLTANALAGLLGNGSELVFDADL